MLVATARVIAQVTASSRRAVLIPLIVSALAGCGGGGGSGSAADGVEADEEQGTEVVDRLLTRSEALALMSQGLTAVRNDVRVQVALSAPSDEKPPTQTIACDKLGVFLSSMGEFTICQIYDIAGDEGAVARSPDGVDLVARVAAGTAGQVLADTAADLAEVGAPVLKDPPSCYLGQFVYGERVTGRMVVQAGRAEDLIASCTGLAGTRGDVPISSPTIIGTEGRAVTLQFETVVPRPQGLDTNLFEEARVSVSCTFIANDRANTLYVGSFNVHLAGRPLIVTEEGGPANGRDPLDCP